MNDDLQPLRDALDLAVHDASHWDLVCQVIVDMLGATGALLPPSNPHVRGIWMSGTARMKAALFDYLAQQWNLKDPREAVLTLMFERGYATDDEVFPDRSKKAAIPIYKDFLRPLDFGNVCTIRIQTPNGYWPLTVHFANDHPLITDDQIQLIKTIQPMFERATKLADQVAHKRIIEFAQFFKGSESEVFIFDADGNQCFNVDNNGNIKTKDRLSALLPDEVSEDLHQELTDVLNSETSMSLSKAYQLKKNGQTVNVLIIQIPPSLRHFFMPFKACAIRTECTETKALKEKRLREENNLSQSEVATIDLLSAGNTPAMIADLLSLKATTVRQKLKAIYEKVNVSGQVELIAYYNTL